MGARGVGSILWCFTWDYLMKTSIASTTYVLYFRRAINIKSKLEKKYYELYIYIVKNSAAKRNQQEGQRSSKQSDDTTCRLNKLETRGRATAYVNPRLFSVCNAFILLQKYSFLCVHVDLILPYVGESFMVAEGE